ncbi:hypothetical protein [Desulfothermobacter acidiphilus]|uniref:hypothetical protein n=1 Tax=Desulfothermobacter acidiphilus TaxID=1938353 RepID=UPI003F89CAE9
MKRCRLIAIGYLLALCTLLVTGAPAAPAPTTCTARMPLVPLSAAVQASGVEAHCIALGGGEVLVTVPGKFMMRLAAGQPYMLAVIHEETVDAAVYRFPLAGTELAASLPHRTGSEPFRRVELPVCPQVREGELWVPEEPLEDFLRLAAQSSTESASPAMLVRELRWTYWDSEWRWRLEVPVELYQRYAHRPPDYNSWYHGCVPYTQDPINRELLCNLSQILKNTAPTDPWERIAFTTELVQQAVPYVAQTYRYYPQYPIETIVDGGDCKGKAVLLAGLLREMGFRVALVLVELGDKGHLAVGVECPSAPSSVYRLPHSSYIYLEATAPGWPAGTISPFYYGAPTRLFPLN